MSRAGNYAGLGGSPISPATTWDPTDKGVDVVLSLADLKATWTQASGWQAARSTTSKTEGRWYLELLAGAVGAECGIVAASAFTTTLTVASTVGGKTASGWSAGQYRCIAVDVANKLLWFREGISGNWNGNPSADPSAGSGGVDISSLSGPLEVAIAGTNSGQGPITANFGATPFAGVVPAGFISWSV